MTESETDTIRNAIARLELLNTALFYRLKWYTDRRKTSAEIREIRKLLVAVAGTGSAAEQCRRMTEVARK